MSSSVSSCSSGASKKSKSNGFMTFMFEQKRNNNFADMMQAQLEAGKLWEKMSDDERAPYHNKAEGKNGSSTKKPKVKYTCIGLPISKLEDAEEAKRKEQMTTEDTIQSMLKKNSIEALKSTTFYFMAASYYYKSFTGEVYPAELALAKFSLKEGIEDEMHLKIYPGELPIGSASAAHELSKTFHGYSLPPNPADGAESDYNIIFAKISQFLGVAAGDKRPQYPPIFVHPGYDDLESVKYVLESITVRAKVNLIFRVYPMENLFFKLVQMVNELRPTGKPKHKNFVSVQMARSFLKNDPFSHLNVGCKHHEETEKSEHCCLAKVKRWGGIIAMKILDPQFDDIVVEKHVPIIYGSSNDEVVSVSSRQSEFSDSYVDMMSRSVSKLSLNSVSEVASADSKKSLQYFLRISRHGRTNTNA